MIKIENASIRDSLPDVVANDPWCIALDYALQRQIKKIFYFMKRACIWISIDTLDERLLDVLAVELRTPQYSETFPVETKRSMIKGSLAYYAMAGTNAALEMVCKDIFGSAEVIDWYDYGGETGYFKIQTDNPNITDENVHEFVAVAENVKRLSAWLDKIEIMITAKQEVFMGAFLMQRVVHKFGNRDIKPLNGGEY